MPKPNLKQLQQLTESAVATRMCPGGVVGAIQANGERIIFPFGKTTYQEEANDVQKNAVFDIASITKSIPISSLGLKLHELGVIDFEDKIITYLPEFNNNYRELLQIKHLFLQTIDCNYRLSDYKHCSPEELLQIVLTGDFNNPPGTTYFQTNAATILLGSVIERATKQSIAELSHTYFFKPLHMEQTTFSPTTIAPEKFIPTEFDSWRNRVIQGEVHDESAYVLRQNEYPAPAGLFSTASDLLTFLAVFINDGRWNGTQFFQPETIHLMVENQVEHLGGQFSFGWDVARKDFMGQLSSPHAFGRTGYTGCAVIADPIHKIGIVILTNYHFPTRKKNWDSLYEFRQTVADFFFTPENWGELQISCCV